MRFSVFTASMLAGSAAAAPWRSYPNKQCSGVSTVTVTVTAGAATTPVAVPTTTAVVSVIPTTTAVVSVIPSSTTAAAAVTTTAAPSTGSGDLSADASAALAAHNSARADVGNAALTWDATLVAGAQEWANNLASTGSFEHSGADGVGENLYMQSGSDNPFTNAVNAFLSEKSQYHGEVIDSSNYMNFGHYTQCVWKSTTSVGMASAKGSDGNTYVVARYSPPGNYMGEKPY